MTRAILVVLALSAAPARCQPTLGAPLVGLTIDVSGVLREVRGISGAFTLGDAKASQVLSLACGAEMCVAKTESQVISDNGAADAPAGAAYIAIDGAEATIYFSSTRQFVRWQDGYLAPLEGNVDGDVLSLGLDSAHGLVLAVRRADGVWIVDSHGNALRFLRAADGPVLLLGGGSALYAAGDRVTLSRADGFEVSFDVPDVRALFAMGEYWAGVRADGAAYAVRIEPGREQIFALPEPAP